MVRLDKKIFKTPTQDVSSKQEFPKDMFRIGRRSGVSTSELGLYSDHSEYYNTNIYGGAVRKFVIGIMVVVSVILIGIFLYDFASSASIGSKVSQETKHIYILQNSFKKSNNGTSKKSIVTLPPTIYIVNSSHASILQDRMDDDHNLELKDVTVMKAAETRTHRMIMDNPDLRIRNLQNFKIRNSPLDQQLDEKDASTQDKQTIGNHAMIYRVRSEYSYSDNDSEKNNSENEQQAKFSQFELQSPQLSSFKRRKYPQLTQYRYPHTSRNIQDIIKYLTNNPGTLNRSIKFAGFYISPKKYDSGHIDTSEITISNESENQGNVPYTETYNSDPLHQYKPKHPSDVNLLATSNFRFAPVEMHRYNSHYDPYYHRPILNNYSNKQNQYNNGGLYIKNYRKKPKPKPFSVMLDIYPITDLIEQTSTSSVSNSQSIDYESRPIIPFFETYTNLYGIHTQSSYPISIQNQHKVSEEDEKHQMILHLNIYPKQKIKAPRNSDIQRSDLIPMDENEELLDKVTVPLETISKRLIDYTTVKDAKIYKNKDLINKSKKNFQKTSLKKPQSITEIKEAEAKIFIGTTQINNYNSDCVISNTTMNIETIPTEKQTINLNYRNSSTFKNTNTVEGFQKFADSLIAID